MDSDFLDAEETLDDLVADALPPDVEQLALPLELNRLFPWHRPRKQKVREGQWVGLSKTLIDRLGLSPTVIQLPDGSEYRRLPEVRYLTLPGLDYLDVRLLGEAVRNKGFELTSVGFLDGASETRVLARARVRESGLIQAGFISDRSLTFPRKLESVCSLDGDSLRELKQRAPFHIVNIDACGSAAPKAAQHSSRLVDAIHRLVELQIGLATHRWLLFLTVDVRDGDMDPETFDSLCDAIRENAAKSDEFGLAAARFFDPEGNSALDEAMATAKAGPGRGAMDVFALGISKWLLHLAEAKQWTVRLKRSHCYATTGGREAPPTMCSLALEFIPPSPGLEDRFGVSRQAPSPGGPIGDPSMQILRSATEMDDLDAVFANNEELVRQMNMRTRELLLEAGYENDALRALEPPPLRRFPDMPKEPD